MAKFGLRFRLGIKYIVFGFMCHLVGPVSL